MTDWVCIPLSGTPGGFAMVDRRDAPHLSKHRWHYSGQQVQARVDGRSVSMARLILAPPPGLMVDHINRDKLDNRRENLRVATRAQNAANTRRRSDNKTGYRGVCLFAGRYRAQCMHGGKVRTRFFENALEAARQYDEWAREMFGPFASLNFPREGEASAHRPGEARAE